MARVVQETHEPMAMHQCSEGNRLARLESQLHDLCRLVRGNGERGLVERIVALETRHSTAAEIMRWVGAIAAGAISAAIGRII